MVTPKQWRTQRLSDIAEFRSGWRNSQDAVPHGQYPFFTCSQEILRHHEFDFDTEAVIMAGNNADARFHLKYFKGKFAARQRTYIISPKSSATGCRFLFYLLQTLQPHFAAQSQGTTTKFVTIGILRDAPVVLPPRSEQEAISNFLGMLDDKIELNRRIDETLEAMIRAIFKSWFVDFDPVYAKAEGRQPAGMDAKTAALFPDSFEDSELGQIPARWRQGRLDDVSRNQRHVVGAESISEGTPYVGLEHMPRKSVALTEWGLSDGVQSSKSRFQSGDVLFGKLRPYFHKVVFAPTDGVCSTDILVIRPTSPEWAGFVLGHASSEELVAHADASSTGTKMPRTSWGDLARFTVLLPDDRVAAAFNTIATALTARIRVNIFECQTLAALRDALLPKLLSGEIRAANG